MSKKYFVGLAAMALAVAPVLASPAHARDGDVRKSGPCSGSASWKLKAGKRDGGLEVEAEVDSNISGQSWAWTLKRDGVQFASGTTVTGGASGSFSVERRTGNGAGVETISFRATHNGQVCKGSLQI